MWEVAKCYDTGGKVLTGMRIGGRSLEIGMTNPPPSLPPSFSFSLINWSLSLAPGSFTGQSATPEHLKTKITVAQRATVSGKTGTWDKSVYNTGHQPPPKAHQETPLRPLKHDLTGLKPGPPSCCKQVHRVDSLTRLWWCGLRMGWVLCLAPSRLSSCLADGPPKVPDAMTKQATLGPFLERLGRCRCLCHPCQLSDSPAAKRLLQQKSGDAYVIAASGRRR